MKKSLDNINSILKTYGIDPLTEESINAAHGLIPENSETTHHSYIDIWKKIKLREQNKEAVRALLS